MRKLFIASIVCAVIMFCVTSVYADGYLFKLKDDIAVSYSIDSSVKTIQLPDDIIYSADNMEDVYSFTSAENIETIFEDCEIELFDIPNDPYYPEQWGFQSVNAYSAHTSGFNGKGVNIAVIDSGINYGHEDINPQKITKQINMLSDTSDVTDEVGHGSFVSGIIGADTNNGIGISGIADGAAFSIYKIFSSQTTNFSYLLSALSDAVNSGYDVINMSLGVSASSLSADAKATLQSIVDTAIEKNILLISAVGNNSSSILNYPAALEGVTGVGAVGKTLKHSSFSNTNESVFICAPGEYLASTWYGESNSYNIAKSYSTSSGTSFAAPYVTAMAALAKQAYKDMNYIEFQELLKASSTDLGTTGYDTEYGWGLIDIQEFTRLLSEKYSFSVSTDSDTSSVSINNFNENAKMYTAYYSGNTLQNTQISSVPLGSFSMNLSTADHEGYDSAVIFFWDDIMPLSESLGLSINTD